MTKSNQWRPKGTFELKLVKEIEQANAVQQELYTIFQRGIVIPPKESTMNRLSEYVNEPIFIQIQNITRFHSGHILAEKVFNQMSDEGVWLLVEYMLMNKKHHVALNELHHSFDKRYWMRRLSVVKSSCPVWDVIAIPEQVGLIQFGQLLLRHRNILKRKSPRIEKELDFECDLKAVGNRYFIENSYESITTSRAENYSSGLVLNDRIWEITIDDNNDVSTIPIISLS